MSKPETLTATARLRIVKPVDGDWDALGRVLRALRAPAHRVLNAVVRELELDGPGEWWAPTPESVAQGHDRCSPRTAAYRIAGEFWRREREDAAERVAARKKMYTGDDSIAVVEPSSATVLGLTGAAFARWQKFKKERWKGDMSLPSFKGGSPIYVANGKNKDGKKPPIQLLVKDGDVILDLNLVKGGRTELIVQACGGSGFARLRHLLEARERDQIGDVKIVEDDRGKGGWFAMVSYSFPKPEPLSGATMAVHRGVRTFLAVAVGRSDEQKRDAYTTILETGEDIVRHKQGYTARRRSLGQQKRQIGAGAKGHGVARREEHIMRLEDAEARWVRSKCQETAAHFVKLARAKGVGRVLIEDWTNPAKDGATELGEHLEHLVRNFPLAQLRDCIEWAATKAGITVEFVRTDNNSRDCPSCGHRHEQAQVGTFRCQNCQLERNVDMIFAWNMLRRDGKTPGIDEHNAAIKRAGKALRGGKKAA